jgi:D-alanyl-D-alanine carboxypeptidase
MALALLFFSCVPGGSRQNAAAERGAVDSVVGGAGDSGAGPTESAETEEGELLFSVKVQQVLSRALLPGDLARRVLSAAVEGPDFILDLLACLEGDSALRRLVDKSHALPEG